VVEDLLPTQNFSTRSIKYINISISHIRPLTHHQFKFTLFVREISSIKSALLALSLSVFASPSQTQLYNKTIPTEYGPVQGFKYFNQSVLEEFFNISDSNVAAFLGIPFAASTAYQNRWKPPQRWESWNTTFLATNFGPPCSTGGLDYVSSVLHRLN
jgi:hypothetical protein